MSSYPLTKQRFIEFVISDKYFTYENSIKILFGIMSILLSMVTSSAKWSDLSKDEVCNFQNIHWNQMDVPHALSLNFNK